MNEDNQFHYEEHQRKLESKIRRERQQAYRQKGKARALNNEILLRETEAENQELRERVRQLTSEYDERIDAAQREAFKSQQKEFDLLHRVISIRGERISELEKKLEQSTSIKESKQPHRQVEVVPNEVRKLERRCSELAEKL